MGRRLLAVAIGVVLALVSAEIALRVASPGGEGLRGLHQLRPDRPWLYGLAPGAERRLADTGEVVYQINQDGFRDREYTREKPEGVFRIVVLGDSIAFGYGIALDQTFPKILEATLARDFPERRFEVLNLGVSGYNPYTEAALFDDVGVTYDPDLVIVEFCINDLNDPTGHFDASTMETIGELPAAAFPDPSARRKAAPWTRRLCEQSRLCASLARSMGWKDPAFDEPTLAPHEHPNPTELAWLESEYAGIAQRAAALGAPFVVAVFPYATQLEPGAATDVQRRLSELGAQNLWWVVDLLPAFLGAGKSGEKSLFLDLWHPTAAGQRAAAEALVEALRAKGLLGEPSRDESGIELDRSKPRR